MTIEQYIKDKLIECGFFNGQAEQVVERLKASKVMEPMAQRWQDNTEDYPSSVLLVTWIEAEYVALEWIDEFLPKAWFRPVFAR